MKRPLSWCALLIALAAPRPAAAQDTGPTKQQCVDADTDGQSLRMAGKLRAARQKFGVCASTACPAIVRDDCTQRIDEVQRATPSVVFEAKDAQGRDLVDVRVTVDGELLADRLVGAALAVDPGPHSFEFEAAGLGKVESKLVMREGEKERHERVVFPAPAAPPPTQEPTPAAAPPPPGSAETPTAVAPAAKEAPAASSSSSMRRTLGIVLGGAGLAGVVVGSVFGAMTFSSWHSSQTECSASTFAACPNHAQAVSDHDTAVTDATISTIAFVAGGAALVGGAYLLFWAPEGAATTGLRIAPMLTGTGSGAIVEGRF